MPSFPGSLGATAWNEDSVELPPGYREGEAAFASPDDLMESFVNLVQGSRGPGPTVRVSGGVLGTPTDTEAQGYVHLVGGGDDSVAGGENRLELRRDESGWFIVSIDQRLHCSRGVAADSDSCL